MVDLVFTMAFVSGVKARSSVPQEMYQLMYRYVKHIVINVFLHLLPIPCKVTAQIIVNVN